MAFIVTLGVMAAALVLLAMWTDRMEQEYRRTIVAQHRALRVMERHIGVVERNNSLLRRIVHGRKAALVLHDTVVIDDVYEAEVWRN